MAVHGAAKAVAVPIATGAPLDGFNARVETFGARVGGARHDGIQNPPQVRPGVEFPAFSGDFGRLRRRPTPPTLVIGHKLLGTYTR